MADDDDDIDMAAAMAEIEAEEAKKRAAQADDDVDMAAAMAEIEAEEAKKSAAAPTVGGAPGRTPSKEAIYDVPVEISVVLGKADLRVHQLLKLGRGAVVELDRRTDEPVDVFADNILIARGEVTVTDDDKLGVTLTDIVRSLFTRAS
ncbi:Flagellar motor switch protein FliN (modular protein) [uncultured Alphaproteobacteria bacterium]|jgi:flagellar motor switch protein FliN/FliY|uniref:Flagellar motor switch protein FliN n=1 Tax=uncultured Alphaproteobacteria bacterium TaxID=91750 RepID=A0A212KKX3_9PROT|nr:Flagellar motor switch protein FliN (modular protein) [uncultured Alphaproteobacteria bacterium]